MNSLLYYIFFSVSVLIATYFSVKYAIDKNLLMVFLIGLCYNCVWTTIVAFSKNLIFDALLYDILVAIFYLALLVVMSGTVLTTGSILGMVLAIIGLVIMHVCG